VKVHLLWSCQPPCIDITSIAELELCVLVIASTAKRKSDVTDAARRSIEPQNRKAGNERPKEKR
jgi:hypothetical protein